jgi:hypothetical protein
MASDLVYNGAHNSLNDLHDNAFFFDEAQQAVYISFKGVSRIIKVKYPEGTVLNTYGIVYSGSNNLKKQLDIQENRYVFFCGQHACRRAADGSLYLFNNGCDLNAPSKITKLREPFSENDTIQTAWEYIFTTYDLGQQLVPQANIGGGNVMELPDGSIFASMGHQCNKVFIVNRDKETLWSAVSEKWDAAGSTWLVLSSYRSAIVADRKELENLIWSERKQ